MTLPRGIRRLVLALAAVSTGLFSIGFNTPAKADNCSCVEYVRSKTGLSGGLRTAADYTESEMWKRKYRKVTPTGGAIMVWDRRQKGARESGHMAIINSARYNNSTKKWEISVRHVNWPTNNCREHDNYFTGGDWGNLYGVNAYVHR